MKKDVIVSISGLQQADEQEPDKVELVTPGRFYLRDGNYYISYHESELTGSASPAPGGIIPSCVLSRGSAATPCTRQNTAR